jgi:hypothetical protein
MEQLTLNLQKIIGAAFHVFMFFVVIYSAMNIFALIRFGRSKIIGFLVFVIYGLLLSAFYAEATAIISHF